MPRRVNMSLLILTLVMTMVLAYASSRAILTSDNVFTVLLLVLVPTVFFGFPVVLLVKLIK